MASNETFDGSTNRGYKIRRNKKGRFVRGTDAPPHTYLRGEKSIAWRGGRTKHVDGYIYVYSPNHPNKDCKQYVFEHRLVMEAHLGRILLPTEVVHHINGIKDDNRIENLMLFSCETQHRKHEDPKKSRNIKGCFLKIKRSNENGK